MDRTNALTGRTVREIVGLLRASGRPRTRRSDKGESECRRRPRRAHRAMRIGSPAARAPGLCSRRGLVRLEGGSVRAFLRHAPVSDRPDRHRRHVDQHQRRAGSTAFNVYRSSPRSRVLPAGRLCGAADPAGATQQADRDKAHSPAMRSTAKNPQGQRGAPGTDGEAGRPACTDGEADTALTERVNALLQQNTDLTDSVKTLVERVEEMTTDVLARYVSKADETVEFDWRAAAKVCSKLGTAGFSPKTPRSCRG